MAGVNVKTVSVLLKILFLTNILVSVNSENCVKKGICACEFENGTYIDLASADQRFYVARDIDRPTTEQWRMVFYYFSPCKNLDLPEDDGASKKCTNSALCNRDILMTKINGTNYSSVDSGFKKLGSIEDVSFLSSNGNTYIKYTKEIITITVKLICSSDEPFLTIADSDPINPALRYYSPSACLGGTAYSRHSFGTTLLIIFFALSLIYLVLGCCIKYFLMGARGIEIIPNINFWRDLPNLIKDGLIFVQNGFKPPPQPSSSGTPVANPNPNSYDSI